jgi:hypothetical protein
MSNPAPQPPLFSHPSGVIVTPGRLVIPEMNYGGRVVPASSYALANVTSITLHTEPPPTSAMRGCGAFAIFGAFSMVPPLAMGADSDVPLPVAVGGLAFWLALAWWFYSKARAMKPTYWIGVRTSGEETRVLHTEDRALAEGLVNGVHRAMDLR